MIEKNELRLGNKVKWCNEIITIKNLLGNYADVEEGVDMFTYKEIEPIKLDEDILLKIDNVYKDYDKYNSVFIYKSLGTEIYLRPSLDKWYFGFVDVDSQKEFEISDCYELEYLHEYQNLIYALTKQELKINL